ncbi:hypothetical protein C8R45DRAFT_978441 [Mycena sanguinolenta]|nr:hypothetical protein C8R45DRAFT_978441 [Mycena sanguinolenta]
MQWRRLFRVFCKLLLALNAFNAVRTRWAPVVQWAHASFRFPHLPSSVRTDLHWKIPAPGWANLAHGCGWIVKA